MTQNLNACCSGSSSRQPDLQYERKAFPDSCTQRNNNQSEDENKTLLPKIVEEAVDMSSHSEMNTTEFLSQYARELNSSSCKHMHMCSNSGSRGGGDGDAGSARNATCQGKFWGGGTVGLSNNSHIVTPEPPCKTKSFRNNVIRPVNQSAKENRGDLDNLPSMVGASTTFNNHKSAVTVYDGLQDSSCQAGGMQSSRIASTVVGEGPSCPPKTATNLTDFRSQDRRFNNHGVKIETLRPMDSAKSPQESPLSPKDENHERFKGTSLAHFVKCKPLPQIDPETNFITTLSSRQGSKRLLKGMSNSNILLQEEEGQLATFRATQLDNNRRQSATASAAQTTREQGPPPLLSNAAQQRDNAVNAIVHPNQTVNKQQVVTQGPLSKYLNNKKSSTCALESRPHDKTLDLFNLGTTFLIDSSSGGRCSHQPQRIMDESMLSDQQREELYSLRQIKEPCELMVPPEESTPDTEQLATSKKKKRPLSATEYTRTQGTYQLGQRRATAKFGKRPSQILPRHILSSHGTSAAGGTSSYLRPHNHHRDDESSIPSVSLPDSSTFCVQENDTTSAHHHKHLPDSVANRHPEIQIDKPTTTSETDGERQDDDDCLLRSLFYLRNERPKREIFETNVGKAVRKAMQYSCVDGQSKSKQVRVELIDFVEKPPSQQSCNRTILEDLQLRMRQTQAGSSQQPAQTDQSLPQQRALKYRSLIYFQISSAQNDDIGLSDATTMLQYGTEDVINEALTSRKFSSFDQLYSKVTEKLVAKVAKVNSSQKQGGSKTLLMIGENDTNMVEPPSTVHATMPKTASQTKMAKEKDTSASLHDRLYKEGLEKRNRQQKLEQRIKSQRVFEETKECTFHPQIFPKESAQATQGPQMVLSERQNPRQHNRLCGGGTKANSLDLSSGLYQTMQIEGTSPSLIMHPDISRVSGATAFSKKSTRNVRSPKTFYREMLDFKMTREKKMEKLRALKLKQEEVSRDKVLSADDRDSPRSPKMKKTMITKRSEVEIEAFFRKLSTENLHKTKNTTTKSPTRSHGGNSRSRKKLVVSFDHESSAGFRTTRNRPLNVPITEHLYNEHFLRENKRQARQAQVIAQVKNVTIDLKRSKQILAQKIAHQIDQIYAQITGQWPLCSTSALVTQDEFRTILYSLGYLTNSLTDSVEQGLFEEAWDLLQQDDKVSLANVNTFLAVIEKLHIIEIHDNDRTSNAVRKVVSERSFGGLDANGVFLLQSDAEASALHKHFVLLTKNKQLVSEQQRLEQILNMHEASKRSEATFKPKICPRSDKLARKNRSEVLHKQSGSSSALTAAAARQARGAIEDILLIQGDLTRQRLIRKRSDQAISSHHLRKKVASFSPRDRHQSLSSLKTLQQLSNRSAAAAGSKQLSSKGTQFKNQTKDTASRHFEKLYKADAEKRQKQELSRAKQRQFLEKKELEEAVFKPNLTKTRKQNEKVQSRHLLAYQGNTTQTEVPPVHQCGNLTTRESNQQRPTASSFLLHQPNSKEQRTTQQHYGGGSQTQRQPPPPPVMVNFTTAASDDNKENIALPTVLAKGNNTKRSQLLKSFLTTAMKKPTEHSNKHGWQQKRQLQQKQEQQQQQQSASLTDKEIMEKLGITTDAAFSGILAQDKSLLLDETSSSFLMTPFNHQSQQATTIAYNATSPAPFCSMQQMPTSVEHLTADVEITKVAASPSETVQETTEQTKLERFITTTTTTMTTTTQSGERFGLAEQPLSCSTISPLLDQTQMTVPVEVSNFIDEEEDPSSSTNKDEATTFCKHFESHQSSENGGGGGFAQYYSANLI